MKKVISIIIVCLCVAGLVLTFVSCGSSPSKKMIGTWYCENGGWSLDITKDYIAWEDEGSFSYYIGNDNTLHIDADGGMEMKYNPELKGSGSDDEWNCTGEYLYFDGDVFTKQ